MFELDEPTVTAALRELAVEDEAALDRVVDATAERAHGRSLLEVEAMLRAGLHREGLDPGEDLARVAEQIVRAVNPSYVATWAGSPSG